MFCGALVRKILGRVLRKTCVFGFKNNNLFIRCPSVYLCAYMGFLVRWSKKKLATLGPML
jgi:hypothetical protein